MNPSMNSTVQLSESSRWIDGNEFKLLENGEEYFPAVFKAIAAAKREILIETFILFDDAVGRRLQRALIEAGQRGVSIDLTVDGYGSPDLSAAFIHAMTVAGVRLHFFDPRPRLLGLRTNIFRRLHRKIVAIDGEIAFVGGINFAADHVLDFGPKAKQDYAVRVIGPLAVEIHRFAREQTELFGKRRRWWSVNLQRRKRASDSGGKALFVTRDNDRHRDDIERHYRIAIRAARREIVIANAYFFPGYRLIRQLRAAARRGVKVKLLLQGEPDMVYAKKASCMLYAQLLQAGIEIHEYYRRPLHAKVAVVDDEWSTVGSSNLDPLSLALNLEANVIIRDPTFNRALRERLQNLLERDCCLVDFNEMPRPTFWQLALHTLAFHCTRYFPTWAGWLPARAPRVTSIEPEKLSEAQG